MERKKPVAPIKFHYVRIFYARRQTGAPKVYVKIKAPLPLPPRLGTHCEMCLSKGQGEGGRRGRQDEIGPWNGIEIVKRQFVKAATLSRCCRNTRSVLSLLALLPFPSSSRLLEEKRGKVSRGEWERGSGQVQCVRVVD